VGNPKYAWLKGEPSLEETLADPIVRLVLARSGLTVQDLHGVIEEAARKLPTVSHPTQELLRTHPA